MIAFINTRKYLYNWEWRDYQEKKKKKGQMIKKRAPPLLRC